MEQNKGRIIKNKQYSNKFKPYKKQNTNQANKTDNQDEELLDDQEFSTKIVLNDGQTVTRSKDDEELLDDPDFTTKIVLPNNSSAVKQDDEEELLDDPDFTTKVVINNSKAALKPQNKKQPKKKQQNKAQADDDDELLDDPELNAVVVVADQKETNKFEIYRPDPNKLLLSESEIKSVMQADNKNQQNQTQNNQKNQNQKKQNKKQPNSYSSSKYQTQELPKLTPQNIKQNQNYQGKQGQDTPRRNPQQNMRHPNSQNNLNSQQNVVLNPYQREQLGPQSLNMRNYNSKQQNGNQKPQNDKYQNGNQKQQNGHGQAQQNQQNQKQNKNHTVGVIKMKSILQDYLDYSSKYETPVVDYHDYDQPNYIKTKLITDMQLPPEPQFDNPDNTSDREYFPQQAILPRMQLPKQKNIKTLDDIFAEQAVKVQMKGPALKSDHQVNQTDLSSIAAQLGIKVPSNKQAAPPEAPSKPKILISSSGIEITVNKKATEPAPQQPAALEVRGSSLNQGFVKERSSTDDMSFLTSQVVSRDINMPDLTVERPVLTGHAVVEKKQKSELFIPSFNIKQPNDVYNISDDEDNHDDDRKFLNDIMGIEEEDRNEQFFNDEQNVEEEEEVQEEEDEISIQAQPGEEENITPISPVDIVPSGNGQVLLPKPKAEEEPVKEKVEPKIPEKVEKVEEEEEEEEEIAEKPISEEVIIPARSAKPAQKGLFGGSNIYIFAAVFVVILAIVAKLLQ